MSLGRDIEIEILNRSPKNLKQRQKTLLGVCSYSVFGFASYRIYHASLVMVMISLWGALLLIKTRLCYWRTFVLQSCIGVSLQTHRRSSACIDSATQASPVGTKCQYSLFTQTEYLSGEWRSGPLFKRFFLMAFPLADSRPGANN